MRLVKLPVWRSSCHICSKSGQLADNHNADESLESNAVSSSFPFQYLHWNNSSDWYSWPQIRNGQNTSSNMWSSLFMCCRPTLRCFSIAPECRISKDVLVYTMEILSELVLSRYAAIESQEYTEPIGVPPKMAKLDSLFSNIAQAHTKAWTAKSWDIFPSTKDPITTITF